MKTKSKGAAAAPVFGLAIGAASSEAQRGFRWVNPLAENAHPRLKHSSFPRSANAASAAQEPRATIDARPNPKSTSPETCLRSRCEPPAATGINTLARNPWAVPSREKIPGRFEAKLHCLLRQELAD